MFIRDLGIPYEENYTDPVWSPGLGECDDMAQEIPQTIESNFTTGPKYITLTLQQLSAQTSHYCPHPAITHHQTQ